LYYDADRGPKDALGTNRRTPKARLAETGPSVSAETHGAQAASNEAVMDGSIGILPFPAVDGLATAANAPARPRTRVDHKNTEEAALVRRIQAQDEMAFREIVERYQAKVFSIIYGILRNRNDAEDIAQQVFAKVYFSIRNFDFRSSLLTWIYKITVNECYDYLRKKKVRKLVYESDFSEEDAQRMEASEPAIDASVPADTRLAQRDLIIKLLGKISEEERTLMLMKEVEGHSVEELAELTGLNENTIKVKLFRTRQKLLRAAARLSRARIFGPGAEQGTDRQE
jgi:RNA polymerase sigma-70 factor (ECF subfamily)